jgi:hypothetical protein
MAQDAGIFFYAVCLTWVVSLLLARNGAGAGVKAPLTWHPAGWLSEGVALGRAGGKFWAGVFFCSLGAVAGGAGLIGGLVGVLILSPLPFLLIDYCRRDSRVRQVKRVFFNPLHAVTSQPVRELTSGRVDERVMKLYFCIDAEAWASLSQVMGEPVRQYLEKRRINGSIFGAEADNDFLQVYDSLGLSRFLIEPSNTRIIDALCRAAGGDEESDRGTSKQSAEPDRGERIITAGAALGVDSGEYAKSSKKQQPSGKARSVPLAPPEDLGGDDDGEN